LQRATFHCTAKLQLSNCKPRLSDKVMLIGSPLLCPYKFELNDAGLTGHRNNDARRFHHHLVAVDSNKVYAIGVKDRLTGCCVNMSSQHDPICGLRSRGVFACPSHLRLHHYDSFSIGQRRCSWSLASGIHQQQPKPRRGNGHVACYLVPEWMCNLISSCSLEIEDLPTADKIVLGHGLLSCATG